MYIRPAIESEATLLGGLILESILFVNVKDKLCPADFYTERHQRLFKAMKELHEKHGSFDLPMLSDHIDYEDSDDIAHLYDLANNCCSTANLNAHADIIREKSVQRKLLACAREIKEEQKKSMNHQELLVSYLEETAAEIKSATIDAHYLKIILFEISNAFVNSVNALENEEMPLQKCTLADLHQMEQ